MTDNDLMNSDDARETSDINNSNDDALLAALSAWNDELDSPIADTTEASDQAADDTDGDHTFDVDGFLTELDRRLNTHESTESIDEFMQDALTDAENARDDMAMLTILNELMGFYRSRSKHDENQWIIQRALELAIRLGLEDTEAWATTLINAATAQRAAGNTEQAEQLYTMALAAAASCFDAYDRRLAALHNNMAMLYADTDRNDRAQHEYREALAILEHASVDAAADIDIASTCTNLALALLGDVQADNTADDRAHALDEAQSFADRALQIYEHGDLRASAHYASALAGAAQVAFMRGRVREAADYYRQALAIIAQCYGTDTDYYRTVAHNLQQVEALLPDDADDAPNESTEDSSVSSTASSSMTSPSTSAAAAHTSLKPDITGLQLSKAYWLEVGKPVLMREFPDVMSRAAVGLVGHGSECYGFDDTISHDHDFGARFCVWLTDEDYAEYGERMQQVYESLPQEFRGFMRDAKTSRAQGAQRRDGVFAIGDFFESLTGYRQAPAQDAFAQWLMLDEATLAAATNGLVFADPYGAFSKARQGFKLMPEDVQLARISRRLGMMGQAGQANLPRMLARADGAAAMACIHEFVEAAASLAFLITGPVSAGYVPYYKWRFAALRTLCTRMGMLLPDMADRLERILRLSSAACFGGAGFGEGGRGAHDAAHDVQQLIEDVCADVVRVLQHMHLTSSSETFLEWQRPYVEEHIVSSDPILHSL